MFNRSQYPHHSKFDSVFKDLLQQVYQKYRDVDFGSTTDILPGLEQADPDNFAIAAVTADGRQYAVGSSDKNFSIQSVSKPFVYGMALEDQGEDHVRRIIGVEPTGTGFNSMIKHEEVSEGRFNPMVNVGAVTTTSLIKGGDLQERIDRLMTMFAQYVGHDVAIDEEALNSRRKLDNLNRAIAYFMLSEGCLAATVKETVELYAHQCSLSLDCRDLAVMAATLANFGINPVTGQRAVTARYVKNILSVMFTNGMYEFSGQWAYRVGLPAKSGVAGAVIAVVPGVMGLAAYSPLLGPYRKSVRGVRAIEEISNTLHCHVFDNPDPGKNQETATPVIRNKKYFKTLLDEIHTKYRALDSGEIYSSEPGLHPMDKNEFAICIATTDGEVFETGDSQVDFFIQSVSKLFVYGLALEDHGREEVLKWVDVEPTGDAYNAVISVETASKRPHNPMVNAGGIAITSLVKGDGPAKRLNRILAMYQRYAGRQVFIDAPAFVSEQAANDRNRAISYLLRNFGMIEGDIEQTLDLYLQQCSAIINCRDLAVMGATLANGGINPITGTRAINGDYIRDLLTVMYTCGMYDFAGEWAYTIGLPAKSGVSGCILGVVPGRMGIAAFSRPLDQHGNSMRGIKVFEELSRRLHFHIFQSDDKNAV